MVSVLLLFIDYVMINIRIRRISLSNDLIVFLGLFFKVELNWKIVVIIVVIIVMLNRLYIKYSKVFVFVGLFMLYIIGVFICLLK